MIPVQIQMTFVSALRGHRLHAVGVKAVSIRDTLTRFHTGWVSSIILFS